MLDQKGKKYESEKNINWESIFFFILTMISSNMAPLKSPKMLFVVEKIAVFEIPYLSHICTVHESSDLMGILNDEKYKVKQQ